MLGVDRCNSSILQNTMFAAYTLTLVCSLVCSADHNLHHFVRTTSPFEFLVEIPRFMSQVTPGHGHLTFTESLTRVPYYEELTVWKRLIHPNVVPTLGAGPDIGELCVTFPWMSEGDLL